MLTNKKISITIPAYNEEETIEYIAQSALDSVSKITPHYEIVLVNDGSFDSTGPIMNALKKKFHKHIKVIHHKKNEGFSGAMQSCYKNATGEFIFLGPADGQFAYVELKRFVKEMLKGKDIVAAYRILNEETRHRKINSFLFHLLSRILFGISLKEFTTCMLYKKKVRDAISIYAAPQSALFLPEFFYKAIQKKYKIGQVPIHFYKRKAGMQKGTNFKMVAKTLQEMGKFWLNIKLGKI